MCYDYRLWVAFVAGLAIAATESTTREATTTGDVTTGRGFNTEATTTGDVTTGRGFNTEATTTGDVTTGRGFITEATTTGDVTTGRGFTTERATASVVMSRGTTTSAIMTSPEHLTTSTVAATSTASAAPCVDVDDNCAYLDQRLAICSEAESARTLCARTCNLCGQKGATMPPEAATPMLRPLVTSAFVATGTATDNRCHAGFVQCLDGRCEPYESLCEETGFVTTVAPPSMATSGAVSMATGTMASSMAGVSSTTPPMTSEMRTQTTTSGTTRAVVTVSAGPNGCADGWERCADQTCEPFHWLCAEHDGTGGVIG